MTEPGEPVQLSKTLGVKVWIHLNLPSSTRLQHRSDAPRFQVLAATAVGLSTGVRAEWSGELIRGGEEKKRVNMSLWGMFGESSD